MTSERLRVACIRLKPEVIIFDEHGVGELKKFHLYRLCKSNIKYIKAPFPALTCRKFYDQLAKLNPNYSYL